MAYLFRTTTDGLGHATLRGCQERWEEPPAYAGDDDTLTLETATDAVIEQIGRACRTFDKAAAVDLLKSAALMLDQLCEDIDAGGVVL